MQPATRRHLIIGAIALALLGLGEVARFARRRPAAPATATPAATARDATRLLVLRAQPGRLELVSSAVKPFACPPATSGDLRWRVEDKDSGDLLAFGATAAPLLCRCTSGHAEQGCVTPKHEAVVRVKVPHRAARERVRFVDQGGRELASFDLEDGP